MSFFLGTHYAILMTRLESISKNDANAEMYIYDIGWRGKLYTALAYEGCNLRELVLITKLMPRHWQSISKSKHRKVPRYILKSTSYTPAKSASASTSSAIQVTHILVWFSARFSIAKLLASARLIRNANRNWYFAPMQCINVNHYNIYNMKRDIIDTEQFCASLRSLSKP